jgi:hypothetical protein
MKNDLRLNWTFADARNVAVFTTSGIVSGSHSILYVVHDADDGAWQFHSEEVFSSHEDCKVVSLGEIVAMDPSILNLSDLPLGWIATRKSKDDCWQQFKPVEN